jgi:excisionase family DNA binding protein
MPPSLRREAVVPEVPAALTVRLPRLAAYWISRSKLYELIKNGQIRTIKVGAITLIPMTDLASFLGLKHP